MVLAPNNREAIYLLHLFQAGALDPNHVLGVTTLDLVRASTFVGEINNINPECVHVPVIGGHSGVTIIPLLSQSKPALQLADPSKIAALSKRIQEAGTEVIIHFMPYTETRCAPRFYPYGISFPNSTFSQITSSISL